jgi:hypothetical protein
MCFKGDTLKDQLWTCARSSSEQQWNREMEKMKVLDKNAYEWLEKMPPHTWVRAFFSEYPKCDILLNNSCEVFNKYILDAREMPILSIFEKIRCQLMTKYYNKQKELEQMQGPVCPKIRKELLKFLNIQTCAMHYQQDKMSFRYSQGIINIEWTS